MPRHQKMCPLCESGIRLVNYKDERTLGRFITDRGKLLPRRITGACARHQRQVGRAIKRARYLAILPFIEGFGA
jgi:small subunit ribosomal protein S18